MFVNSPTPIQIGVVDGTDIDEVPSLSVGGQVQIISNNVILQSNILPIDCFGAATGSIDLEIARYSLEALSIDKHGLDEMDNKILLTIIDKFSGGPVGLSTIATAVGEETGTIEEVYEPFLIMQGFIKRTPRGREATEHAYKHLGKIPIMKQQNLF